MCLLARGVKYLLHNNNNNYHYYLLFAYTMYTRAYKCAFVCVCVCVCVSVRERQVDGVNLRS